MSTKRISLNGTNFYPSEIEITEQKIQDSDRMANGKLRTWLRAYKNVWTLTWNGLPETQLPGIRTIFRQSSSFPLVNEENVTFTVITTSLEYDFAAEKVDGNGIIHYDVTLELEEE